MNLFSILQFINSSALDQLLFEFLVFAEFLIILRKKSPLS